MGIYINPSNMSKEEWLRNNAENVSVLSIADINDTHLPVVLVNNGAFTAAAVAYSRDELREFTDPNDLRPVMYYVVRRDNLAKVVEAKDVNIVLGGN